MTAFAYLPAIARVVGLNAQQRNNAVFNFVVFLDASTVLLVDAVEKLAAIFALAGLEITKWQFFASRYRPVTGGSSRSWGGRQISLSKP